MNETFRKFIIASGIAATFVPWKVDDVRSDTVLVLETTLGRSPQGMEYVAWKDDLETLHIHYMTRPSDSIWRTLRKGDQVTLRTQAVRSVWDVTWGTSVSSYDREQEPTIVYSSQ